jgi:hypothetical protein
VSLRVGLGHLPLLEVWRWILPFGQLHEAGSLIAPLVQSTLFAKTTTTGEAHLQWPTAIKEPTFKFDVGPRGLALVGQSAVMYEDSIRSG